MVCKAYAVGLLCCGVGALSRMSNVSDTPSQIFYSAKMSVDNFLPFTVVKLERALVKEENNGPSAMSGERQ